MAWSLDFSAHILFLHALWRGVAWHSIRFGLGTWYRIMHWDLPTFKHIFLGLTCYGVYLLFFDFS